MSGAHWNSAGGERAQQPAPPPPPHPDPDGWRSAAASWSSRGGELESAAAGDLASTMHPAVAASSRKRKGSAQQSQQAQPSHGHFTDAASGSPAAPAASGSASSSAPLAETSAAAGAYSTCQLTLGLEVSGKLMHAIVPRGTRLPCTSTQLFSTYADKQQYVSIMVYQVSRSHTHAHTNKHRHTHLCAMPRTLVGFARGALSLRIRAGATIEEWRRIAVHSETHRATVRSCCTRT